MFIAFDPASKYAHDGIFLRFHHWRQTAQGLASLELVIPPIADWSRDEKVHHMAVTFNHGTVTAYLDGTRLGETTERGQGIRSSRSAPGAARAVVWRLRLVQIPFRLSVLAMTC